MYTSTGFISFFLRRLTGVALVLYLFLHIWVIGSVNAGPAAFDARLNLVQTDFFKLMEILLLAGVVWHSVDGIRLMIVHQFGITEYRKSLFATAMFISFLLVVAGGLPIFLFMLEGG